MIEIKSSERKDNRKGPWLVINYINDKGEQKATNVFDQKIIDQFNGPGKYEASWVQNGKYWNLSSLTLVALNGSSSPAPSSGGHMHNGSPVTAAASPQDSTLQAKASIAVAAIEAAATIVSAEITTDGKESEASATDIMDHAALVARILMIEARNFMANKQGTVPSPSETAKPEQQPVGA